MSITVERRYRVTANGAANDMSEDEARALCTGLLAALGLAPATTDIEPVPAMVALPAQLPSGPVAGDAPRVRTRRPQQGIAAYEDRMRALIADGLTAAEVGAAMGVPKGTAQSRAHRLGLRFGGRRGAMSGAHDAPSSPEPGTPAPATVAPLPVVSATEAAAVHGAVGWQPDGGWTPAQTTALIRAMAPGHGGIREASEATGHSMGGCGLRWKHLKSAGIMTVEKYMSGPEAVPA